MRSLAIIVIIGIVIAVYAIWYKPELANKVQEAQRQNPDLNPLQAPQQQAMAKAEEVKQAIIEKMEAVKTSNPSVSAPVMNILPQSFAAQPSAATTMTVMPTKAATPVINTSPMQSVIPAKTAEAIASTPSRPVVPIVSVPTVKTGSGGTGTSRVFVERKYT